MISVLPAGKYLLSATKRFISVRPLGHSVGSKKYPVRLERRAESFASLETRLDFPGESRMQCRDRCRPSRGTLGPGHKPRWGLFGPAVSREQSPVLTHNSNENWTSLGQLKRKPEFPVVPFVFHSQSFLPASATTPYKFVEQICRASRELCGLLGCVRG